MSAVEFWIIAGIGVGGGVALALRSEHRKAHGRTAPLHWSRAGRWVAGIGAAVWLVVLLALIWDATGNSFRQQFLAFIPAHEAGTPHTAKWLVETCAGDGGWVHTAALPGTLTTTATRPNIAVIRWRVNGTLYAFRLNETGAAPTLTPGNRAALLCETHLQW